ncbi:MAG: site-2 protease family protein [Oscillatoriaceae bacterium SKW80]|nr:site-2 protease family protein [Oscillatoriaceae bacterium SKYG93]MCX8120199.1 site-2 protease family protein [Oscillatoriaceae bacterium SKW80]MDW8453125.1 site-2 protease family protein [Oscillatoriaceae cyanobacterium SKYGB_i_bin93]HIK28963.1 site-2 protease family protein [Oscillatoriaceae cyanobacterium M7585_C2015_266]
MYTASENAATILIVLIALGILGWGYYRARPLGKLGILAWLQSVSLMAPWLIFFGLFAAGIYLNLASILFLLVASAGLYIFLGNRLRAASQDASVRAQLETLLKSEEKTTSTEENTGQEVTNTTAPTAEEERDKITPIITPIPAEELKTIQGIFGIDTFFVTETISYQDGAIFKGNLRGEPETVYARLSEKLQEHFGERYRLFLVPNQDDKPVVIVLPSTNDPKPLTVFQKIIAAVLFLATIATTLEASGLMLGFNFFNNISRFPELLPISSGIWAVLLAHEIGHQVMAKRHQVRFSWPFFIPTWQIGSFGALNRFESLLPNRKVLFDVAFAGPAAGGLVSLGMLITGLLLSHPGSFFQIPSQLFKGSLLVGALAKVVLGPALQQPVVDIHPLAALGWLGLVLTAINLMPAGQLDGGRIVQAIYGRKIATRTTIATLILLAIASLANPVALYWASVILFLQRNLERPTLNDLTEPDDARAALGLLALFLTVAVLLPFTPGLAGRLGIGG